MTFAGAVAVAGLGVGGCSHADPGAPAGDTTAPADARVYVCPMHCVQPGHHEPYSQQGPGDCPVCGMHLVLKPDEQPQPAAAPMGGSGR